MKAYKLIFELIKHPTREVRMLSQYKITHVRYNTYDKRFTLDSIKGEREEEPGNRDNNSLAKNRQEQGQEKNN